ncbi:hypothetical protein [Pseudonocardia endophytica]|uniref:Uncharacterized protein n=1 Tax=Pseudonocardia endophytica TaxID=401976 RepID=A0A4R1HVQ2_PSEEN|nr:hypothetical protein [Pseudonocardia endophytica]TCK26824.1 hypothetical protein EV378_2669 [Pseudonocardia endophytica]
MPHTTHVGAEPGEYHCSDNGCRRVWTHDGGPLRHQPVDDEYSTLTPRRWHPCPSCLDADPLIADFAHDLRRRTAQDILAWV